MIFRVGTRKSRLALKQVEEVIVSLQFVETQNFASLQNISFEIVGIDTHGDIDKATPISDIEGSDFFTAEIDNALLKGAVDFAVHSAKDLPDEIPKGLIIAAVTKSIGPYDALVSKKNLKIDELNKGARIGASSLRRKEQLKKYRPDFQLVDIRGNIQERLERLDKPRFCHPFLLPQESRGDKICLKGRPIKSRRDLIKYVGVSQIWDKDNLDAIIVAGCALKRLGLECRISQRIPLEILKPHPLQGSLAIVAREGDKELIKLLRVLNGR